MSLNTPRFPIYSLVLIPLPSFFYFTGLRWMWQYKKADPRQNALNAIEVKCGKNQKGEFLERGSERPYADILKELDFPHLSSSDKTDNANSLQWGAYLETKDDIFCSIERPPCDILMKIFFSTLRLIPSMHATEVVHELWALCYLSVACLPIIELPERGCSISEDQSEQSNGTWLLTPIDIIDWSTASFPPLSLYPSWLYAALLCHAQKRREAHPCYLGAKQNGSFPQSAQRPFLKEPRLLWDFYSAVKRLFGKGKRSRNLGADGR